MAASAKFSEELSELFTKLWELDVNRCKPGSDYSIDLQGYVNNTNLSSKDWAVRNFFSMFNEEQVFSKPTFGAFRALLDNYEMDTSKQEVVTAEEAQENRNFIDLVCETSVMQEAHKFLVSRHKAPENLGEFKRVLLDIWFKLYRRTVEDQVSNNSSGFEHVFVGETRSNEVIGFHNWIQLYLQEKAGNLDYRGFFRRGTTEQMEKSPRIVTLQFSLKKCGGGKPIGSSFIGTSPEFEMAIYTTMFLLGREKVLVRIKSYDLELVCLRHGRGIGTAFPMSKSD